MIEFALAKMLHDATTHIELDVQENIEPGSFTALFGASGAGKTTLLRMLAGITAPDRGTITIDGETWFDSTRRIDLPPQQRAIGFVFQDGALFPNLDVRRNVAYASHDDAWIDELLTLIGLTDLQHRLPHTLSGGQKQRVALARAVARKPRLLLLDEPLSALDAASRKQLQDDLLRLHQRFGFTTLLVSHDLGEVFKLAQRVLHIEQGRIVRAGPPKDIFLQQRPSNGLHLHAQVLALHREDVVHVLSLLIGQDIVEVIASDDEVEGLQQGDTILLAAKSFSPALFRFDTSPH
jgi:molybdate transport system ATP-binding protein